MQIHMSTLLGPSQGFGRGVFEEVPEATYLHSTPVLSPGELEVFWAALADVFMEQLDLSWA